MKPTSEERILAVISHLSALALGAGVIIPAVFWTGQREKSKYAAFQSLQAYGYQTLGYTFWMLSYLLVMMLIFVALIAMAFFTKNNPGLKDTISTTFAIIILVVVCLGLGIYLLLPVIGALMCGMGRDFRYPILGSRLGRYLGYDPAGDASLDSAAEERFAASMGHFAVILPLIGLLGPLYLWASLGKRSPFLRFQSAQTAIYQGLVNLFTYGMGFLSIFSLVLVVYLATPMGGEGAALAGLMAMTCVLMITMLIVPCFHILGQWAGLQILRGRDFRYPLIGQFAAKWLKL